MIYGYARCSTNEDKDIQRQVRELKAAGAEQVFLEYEHGDSVIKEQLAALMDKARAGDTILTLEVRPCPQHKAVMRHYRACAGKAFAPVYTA